MADNVVEILVRSKNKTKEGFTDAVASSETAADKMQAIWSKHSDAINAKLKNLGKNVAVGGGLLSLGSAALAAAGPLGALTLAVGAFGAVAAPELKKGSKGAKELGDSFHGLQKTMAPLVDKVIDLGTGLLKHLLPSLTPLAKAGASVITAFIKPLDAFVRSKAFDSIIASFAQFAVQAGKLTGPVLTQLIKLLLQLFVQLFPSGMQILKILLPLIVQLVTDLTPVIVTLAKVTAGVLNWLTQTRLLKPVLLGLIPVIMLLVGSSGIGAILIAISLLAAGIVELVKNWSKIWTTIKNITSEAVKFLGGLFRELPAPLQNALRLIGAIWKTAWDSIRGQAKTAWDLISGLFRVFTDLLKGNWSAAGNALKQTASRVWNDIRAQLTALWHNLGSVFGATLNLLKSEASAAWGAIRSAASSAWNSIWNNTVSRARAGVADVVSFVRSLPGKLVSALGNAGSVLTGWGKGVIQGLLSGMTNIIGSVWNFIKGIPGKILGFLGIHSPPQWAIEAGKHIMNGLGIGMSQAQHAAGKATAAFKSSTVASVGSGVERWRGTVLQALRMEHLPASLVNDILVQMRSESGGNPNAINLWDSNAKRGDPSRGLMQTIMSTFRAYHWPGTSNNIYDPLANIAAAINYARQGRGFGTGFGQVGSAHGYASGGVSGGGWAMVGEHGRELVRLPGGSMVRSAADTQQMLGAGGGGVLQLEFVGGGQSQVEQFLFWMIQHLVRVKGGGDVQKAFGRP